MRLLSANQGRRLALPLIYAALAIGAWLATTFPTVGQLAPTDGYAVTGRMYQSPQLWVAVVAGCSTWHIATLRARGLFLRSTARLPWQVTVRALAVPLVVSTLSLAVSLVAMCARFGIFEVSDPYLLLVTWVMGLGGVGVGATVGAVVPRLFALPASIAAMFFLTYWPITLRASWVRSLTGGGWSPEPLYRVDGLTIFATTLTFGAAFVWSVFITGARLPGTRRRTTAIVATCLLLVCVAVASVSVRNIGYTPLVARDIDTVCSDTVPQWCVAPWNADELSAFVALNPKIHEIEQRTGARFPARLSQEAPPGPALSSNVDALRPLPSIKLDDGTKDVYRAVEFGLSTTVNPCQQVPPFANLTVAVYASEWWSSQLRGTPLYGNGTHDLSTDIPAQTIRAMTDREQAAWVNSVFEAPHTCTTPLTLPGLDSIGNPLPPTSPKATP